MISFFHDLIFRNFWLKFFSLGLAILIWITVSLAIRKETSPSPGPDTAQSAEKPL